MPIYLNLNYDLNDAQEAKQTLTNLIEVINQEQLSIKSHQESALQNLVKKFNEGKSPLSQFNKSIGFLLTDIKKN